MKGALCMCWAGDAWGIFVSIFDFSVNITLLLRKYFFFINLSEFNFWNDSMRSSTDPLHREKSPVVKNIN